MEKTSLYQGVWVLGEQRDGELTEVTLEITSEGRRIADRFGEELCVALPGPCSAGQADELARCGAEKVYYLTMLPDGQLAESCAEALSPVLTENRPRLFMCSANCLGRDVAARLATMLKTGLASNCTDLNVDENGSLVFSRPVFGGRIDAVMACSSQGTQIATLRPGIKEIKRSGDNRQAEMIAIRAASGEMKKGSRVTGFIKADPGTIAPGESEVIVAGGAGVGKAENFRLLEEMAELLGGTVGSSRVPVDNGWMPFEKQIGQTGTTVSPALFISCGISGSIYHTMGMKDSRTIIAINTDRNAPIFKLADVGIVGDLLEVIPEIIRQLREVKPKDEA